MRRSQRPVSTCESTTVEQPPAGQGCIGDAAVMCYDTKAGVSLMGLSAVQERAAEFRREHGLEQPVPTTDIGFNITPTQKRMLAILSEQTGHTRARHVRQALKHHIFLWERKPPPQRPPVLTRRRNVGFERREAGLEPLSAQIKVVVTVYMRDRMEELCWRSQRQMAWHCRRAVAEYLATKGHILRSDVS